MNDLLNDPTDERLDDRLRTLMRTAVAEPPVPPSIDDLDTLVSVGPEPRKEWFRPLTAVAAAVAVLAVGALVLWPSAEDDVDPADSTVPEVVAGQFLDAYYLPSELPAGWQIVGMERTKGGDVYYSGDVAVFQLSNGGIRGVVSQTPSYTGETTASTEPALDPATGSTFATTTLPSSPLAAVWDESFPALQWQQDGRTIMLTTTDHVETSARSLAADLETSRAGNRTTFDVADGSDWVKTREYLLDGAPVVTSGYNSIHLVSDLGATATMVSSRVDGLRGSDTGTLIAGTADVFVVDDRTRAVVREFGDVQVEAYSLDESATVDELVAMLVALAPANEEAWRATAPDPEVIVRGTPTVASFQLLGHTITAHLRGAVSGICVDRDDGATGCALLDGVMADGSLPEAAPTSGISLSDGTWVAVGDIEADLDPCEGAELQGARAGVAPNGDQQVMFVVPASLDQSFACSLYRDGTPNGVFIANPPTNR